MPDNITFLSIPIGLRTGGTFLEIDNTKANKGLAQIDGKLLLIGQRLASGSVPALTPVRVTAGSQAAGYFGQGSMLHRMAAAIDPVRKLYGMIDVYAIALDDLPAGVQATGSFTITGSATAAATLYAYIGGVRLSCAVAYGDTPSAIATKLAAAINANGDVPVSATANAGVVTVQADHNGTVANGLELAVTYYDDDVVPAGITVACTSLSGGSGDPDVGNALAAITEDWYYAIACAYTDSANLTTLEANADGRWSGTDMRTEHIFNAKSGTQAALTTWGATRNSPHCSTWGLKGSPTWDPERAAALAAVCLISGITDPAMPLRNITVPGVMAPRLKDRFPQFPDRELLLKSGISTTKVDASGNVVLERVITNYQKAVSGIADESLLRLETKWTADYFRYAIRSHIALRFPRHKLADDGTNVAPGQKVVTPKDLSIEIVAKCRDLEKAGIIENVDQFKKELLVVRSSADVDRVNAVLPPDLVNQFVTFAAAVQYRL